MINVPQKKAEKSAKLLEKLGPKIELPLYHQPSDVPAYHAQIKAHAEFRPRLIKHLQKRNHERQMRERYLTDRYDQLMQVCCLSFSDHPLTKDIVLKECFLPK